MLQRPKIKIELTQFDKTFEIVGRILVCALGPRELARCFAPYRQLTHTLRIQGPKTAKKILKKFGKKFGK
jgi:hypothetical protein